MSIRYFGQFKSFGIFKTGRTITTTSSVQGYNPSPILHDYAASKAAIISLTKSFSEELGPKGIRSELCSAWSILVTITISGGQPQSKIPTFGQKHL